MAQAQKQKRVHWSKDEDEKLTNYVRIHGGSRKNIWKHVSEGVGLQRNGKSCRLRWMNFLRPNINKEPLSEDEEATIIKLHEKHGNKWTYIARQLEGRTDTKVKNFWKRYSEKKLPQKETPGLVAQTPLLGHSFATAGFQQLEVNDDTSSFMGELLSASPESSMANQELYGQLEGFGMYETDYFFDLDSFMDELPSIPTGPVSASPMRSVANQELCGQLEGFGMYETDYFFGQTDSIMGELPSISTAPVSASPKSSMANQEQTQIASTEEITNPYPW